MSVSQGKVLTSCSMPRCYETAWINRYGKGNKIPFSISLPLSSKMKFDAETRWNEASNVCSGIWTGWTSFFPWNPRKLLTVSSDQESKKLCRLPTSEEGTKNDKTERKREGKADFSARCDLDTRLWDPGAAAPKPSWLKIEQEGVHPGRSVDNTDLFTSLTSLEDPESSAISGPIIVGFFGIDGLLLC